MAKLDGVLEQIAEQEKMQNPQNGGQPQIEPNQTPNEGAETPQEQVTDPNEGQEDGETSNPNMDFEEEQSEPNGEEQPVNPLAEHGIEDPKDLDKIKQVIEILKSQQSSSNETDPILKQAIELHKMGRSDLASEVLRSDYKKMLETNPKGVIELYLKNIEGVSDPDAIEEMVAEYNPNNHKDMALIKTYADKLTDEYRKKMIDYTPEEVKIIQNLKGANEQYKQNIPNLIIGLEGKKINGVTLDDSHVKKIESLLKNGLGIMDSKTGQINHNQMLEIAKTLVTHAPAIKIAKNGAEIKAKEEVLKTMQNPNPNNGGGTTVPSAPTKKDDVDEFINYHKSKRK